MHKSCKILNNLDMKFGDFNIAHLANKDRRVGEIQNRKMDANL